MVVHKLGRLNRRSHKGFTIVELLVVLAVIALLLSIIMPRYLNKIDEGKEIALRQNLATLRHSIDQYHMDQGVYPSQLEQLVDKRYLRQIPLDPMNGTREWRTVNDSGGSGIYDVKSNSHELGSDQHSYSEW